MNNNILSLRENVLNIKDNKNFYFKKVSLKNFRNHKNLNLNLKNSSILVIAKSAIEILVFLVSYEEKSIGSTIFIDLLLVDFKGFLNMRF